MTEKKRTRKERRRERQRSARFTLPPTAGEVIGDALPPRPSTAAEGSTRQDSTPATSTSPFRPDRAPSWRTPSEMPPAHDLRRRIAGLNIGELLEMAYVQQVQQRGQRMQPDDMTRYALESVTAWLTSGATTALLLTGECGTGKTTMVNAIAKVMRVLGLEYMTDNRRYTLEMPVVSAKQVNRVAVKENERQLAEWATVPMLAVDDMGAEPAEVMVFGRVTTPVGDLLEERYARNLLTVVSGNLGRGAVRATYGARLADRFNEWVTVVTFDRNSYREEMMLRRLAAAGNVPTPAPPADEPE